MSAAQSPALIFLHVPKTAGTTLNRIIEAQYNPWRVYSIPGWNRAAATNRFKRWPENRRRTLQVLKGHMEFGLHKYLPQGGSYITMLRDPVQRVTSSYYYALSNRYHPMHRILTLQKISLERFLEISPWIHNMQAKLIGGAAMDEFAPLELRLAARRGDWCCVEQWDRGDCSPLVLQTAKNNLQHRFHVVGLTERFEESLILLMRAYDWRVTGYQTYRKSGRRPPKTELSPQTQAKIERYNAGDIELYTLGEELFEVAAAKEKEAIARIQLQLHSAPPPGRLRSMAQAGAAWGRYAVSLVRSSM